MNRLVLTFLRAAAFAAALLSSAAALSAAPADPVAQQLAVAGTIPVKAAGPYVQIGSYRIHVEVRLGRPSAVLADGTMLYRNFSAADSAAEGTLVIRFEHGRVSQLALISPRVETAMLPAPANALGHGRIAAK